jgi:hypothetical protein
VHPAHETRPEDNDPGQKFKRWEAPSEDSCRKRFKSVGAHDSPPSNSVLAGVYRPRIAAPRRECVLGGDTMDDEQPSPSTEFESGWTALSQVSG